MKKNKLTILLFILVIFLWSFIGIKTIRFIDFSVYKKIDEPKIISPVDYELSEPDSTSLSLNYPDPFLKDSLVSEIIEKKISEKNIDYYPVAPKLESDDFSFIHYLGVIKNSKDQKQLVLFNINDKTIVYGFLETKNGFTINKIYDDSVQVEINGKRRMIKK